MTRALLTFCGVWLATLAAVSSTGCSPPPPSEDAILYYLGSARYHGPVRRTWPEGQAYLDGIMKPYMAWERELDALRRATTPESLWPKADPRWQDQSALEQEFRYLEELVAEQGPHKPARANALQELVAAIAKLPAGLSFRSEGGRTQFIGRVWEWLADSREAQRTAAAELERLVGERLALVRLVLENVADFATTQPGLHLKDVERQARLDGSYDPLQQALRARREEFMRRAEERLLQLDALIKGIDKRDERWEYELLTNERKGWRDGLDAIAQTLSAAAKATEDTQHKLEKELRRADANRQARLQAEVAFHKQRAGQLAQERDALKTRISAILRRAKAAAERVPTPSRDD